MIVVVIEFGQPYAPIVIEGFADGTEAKRWIDEHPAPDDWSVRVYYALDRTAGADLLRLGRSGSYDPETREGEARPEERVDEGAQIAATIDYTSSRELVERLRYRADNSLRGVSRDDPGAAAEAIDALRLEVRASTVEITDALDALKLAILDSANGTA